MTSFVVIMACIAAMFAIYAVRGNPGRAVADTALLVMLIGILFLINFILIQFIDTGNVASIVATTAAALLAIDALYGLMAPDRQKARDKKLRRLMKRRA